MRKLIAASVVVRSLSEDLRDRFRVQGGRLRHSAVSVAWWCLMLLLAGAPDATADTIALKQKVLLSDGYGFLGNPGFTPRRLVRAPNGLLGIGYPKIGFVDEIFVYSEMGQDGVVTQRSSGPTENASFVGFDGSGQPHFWGDGHHWRRSDGVWMSNDVRFAGYAQDLVVDDQGVLHAVYYVESGANKATELMYGTADGGVVQERYRYQGSQDILVHSISLAVDASGHAHITFLEQRGTYPNERYILRYCGNSTGAWVNQLVKGRNDYGYAGNNASIAAYKGSTPIIAATHEDMHDTGGSTLYSYLQFSTGTPSQDKWDNSYIMRKSDEYYGSDGDKFTGLNPQLAVDGNDHIHIAFSDKAAWHTGGYQGEIVGQLRYANWNGSSWSFKTLLRQNRAHSKAWYQFVLHDLAVSSDGKSIFVLGEEEKEDPPGDYDSPTHDLFLYEYARVAPPLAPTLLTPDSGAEVSRQPTFTWSESDTANWYHIWVGGSAGAAADKWVKATSYTAPKAWAAGTYSWAVRAQNKAGAGAWSPIRNFVIPLCIPAKPELFQPAGVLPDTQREPEFTWTPLDHAQWYRLYLQKDGKKWANAWIRAPSSSWSPSGPLEPGTYTWRVVGWSVDGYGAWSDVQTFEVPYVLPGRPVLVAPLDERCQADVSLRWVHDPVAAWYQLYVGKDGRKRHAQWYKAASVVDGTHAVVALDLPDWGTYDWWVRPWGGDGYGPWSDGGHFRRGALDQESPAGALPSPPAEFIWDCFSAEEASWWHFYVQKDGSLFWSGWVKGADVASDGNRRTWNCQADVRAMTLGAYSWWIQPWSSSRGAGPWSEVAEFSL